MALDAATLELTARELKTILAIGLVVFIVGALIFLKIRAKKK